jgi:chromate transporter
LDPDTEQRGSALEVLAVATRLGLTSFGGPVAHLGYFREEYVRRRHWLDDERFAEILALSQALPGPASSQVGIAIGLTRAGLPGAVLAWLGFTLPSAILLVLFAYSVDAAGDVSGAGWLHGLKVAAVAVVAFAVWGLGRSLASDKTRATIAILAAIAVLSWQSASMQLAVILVAGVIGWRLFSRLEPTSTGSLAPARRSLATAALALFFGLLLTLPIANAFLDSQALNVFDSFYRVGSLVFGGGHVVLPLLEAEVVGPGWVSESDFIAGYGAAQAVPGPLFTFAAYLGAVMVDEPNGVEGAALALVAVFLPSFFLVIGGLAIWDALRTNRAFYAALQGVNAAVVGLLVAALYDPIWTGAITTAADFGLALAAFGLLAFWRIPPWLIVVFCAAGGELLNVV